MKYKVGHTFMDWGMFLGQWTVIQSFTTIGGQDLYCLTCPRYPEMARWLPDEALQESYKSWRDKEEEKLSGKEKNG